MCKVPALRRSLVCVEDRERTGVAEIRDQEMSEREILRVGQTMQGLRGHSERFGCDSERARKLVAGGRWQVAGWDVYLPGRQVQEIITTVPPT